MAEAFGVVASAAGIVGVTAQAFDGIRKLRTFYKDFRDAPEELKYMLDELELLMKTIVSIEAQVQRNLQLCQSINLTAAFSFCKRSIETTNKIVKDLNDEVSKRRTTGSMRTAWRKKSFEAYMAKIERAKTSLALAVSAYTTEINLQTSMNTDRRLDHLTSTVTAMTTCVAQQIQMIQPPFPATSQNTPQRADTRPRSNQESDKTKGVVDTLHRSRTSKTRPGMRTMLTFTLVLPHWIMQRSWQIDVSHAAQGWNVSLRAWRTVAKNCDFFEAIRSGDIVRAQNLIATGQATIFDRDSEGSTVLHIAAKEAGSSGAAAVSKWLIQNGADVNAQNDRGDLAIQRYILFAHFDYYCTGQFMKTSYDCFRVFADDLDMDPELFCDVFERTISTWIDREAADILESKFQLETPTFTTKQRLSYLALDAQDSLYSWGPFVLPEQLALWLGTDQLSTAYMEGRARSRRDLLRVMLKAWGFASALDFFDHPAKAWQNAFDHMTKQGIDFSILRTEDHSIVDEILTSFVSPYVEAIRLYGIPFRKNERQSDMENVLTGNKSFFSQLNCIQIESTAQTLEVSPEYRIKAGEKIVWNACVKEQWFESFTFRYSYGPKREDWSIWITSHEEWCGEFWDMIEHPERAMPGAWTG